jgi:hypothetical protein
MVTMVDELFDRQDRAGRAEPNWAFLDFIRRSGKAVGETFAVLNRIEYSAPWAVQSRRGRSS